MSDEYKYYDCEKCNGTGSLETDSEELDSVCRRCLGAGKLDWIDVLLGGKSNDVVFYDVTTGNVTVTLPAAPREGETITIHSDPENDNGVITIVMNKHGKCEKS